MKNKITIMSSLNMINEDDNNTFACIASISSGEIVYVPNGSGGELCFNNGYELVKFVENNLDILNEASQTQNIKFSIELNGYISQHNDNVDYQLIRKALDYILNVNCFTKHASRTTGIEFEIVKFMSMLRIPKIVIEYFVNDQLMIMTNEFEVKIIDPILWSRIKSILGDFVLIPCFIIECINNGKTDYYLLSYSSHTPYEKLSNGIVSAVRINLDDSLLYLGEVKTVKIPNGIAVEEPLHFMLIKK